MSYTLPRTTLLYYARSGLDFVLKHANCRFVSLRSGRAFGLCFKGRCAAPAVQL